MPKMPDNFEIPPSEDTPAQISVIPPSTDMNQSINQDNTGGDTLFEQDNPAMRQDYGKDDTLGDLNQSSISEINQTTSEPKGMDNQTTDLMIDDGYPGDYKQMHENIMDIITRQLQYKLDKIEEGFSNRVEKI